jgi:UDP-GlcNAc:undecaprenyl-phosphate GlcNAc-1-phosphate transferase
MPYNLSKKQKVFMGDGGSLFIGLLLAATALGTDYTYTNNMGLFAPLLILAVPIYDTLFVMYVRYKKGLSPFLGSKDHFALRLRMVGYSDKSILMRVYLSCVISILLAFAAVETTFSYVALIIYCLFLIAVVIVSKYLYRVKI